MMFFVDDSKKNDNSQFLFLLKNTNLYFFQNFKFHKNV